MSYQALLFCPDEKTARVVTQVLTELDFSVEPCNEPFAAVKKLMAQHFDAVVVDAENEQNATLLFKSARNSSMNHSSLAVAVVEGQAGVAKAFRIGANLVLTKPINVEQSKGTLRVARGLLRKGAETGKAGPESVQKPAMTPPTQAAPEIPPPASSLFELEKEPEPQPEPTEAALLDSMPDPLSKAPAAKDFPWQPVTKPMTEPMASAIRRAAEAAGKKIESPSPVPPASANLSAPSAAKSKESSAPAWGPGAASAPAPAKESAKPAKPILEPRHEKPPVISVPKSSDFAVPRSAKPPVSQTPIAAPSFSTLDESEEARGTGAKKLTIAVAVVLLLAACGYFAWTKMHLSKPASTAEKKVAAQMPAPAPPSSPAIAPPAASMPPAPQPLNIAGTQVTSTVALSASKPTAGLKESRDSEAAAVVTARPTPEIKTPEPVVVRTEAPKAAVHKTGEEPIQPPALAMAGQPAEHDLSQIVTTTPVSVPQPAPQMLKVSQGVSQGLLLKKVQPIYPSQALQMRVQGSVQLLAVISKEGNISNVKVLSGEGVLARAAVEAVRQWKYKPYYLNNEPVDIQTQITVNFRLP